MKVMQTLLKILSSGEAATLRGIASLSGCTSSAAFRALRSLKRRGFALQPGFGEYMITQDGIMFVESGDEIGRGPSGPQQAVRVVENTLRAKIWRAMRIKGKFGIDDIAKCVLDGTETCKSPEDNIRKYLLGLKNAGYLVEMKRRSPGSGGTSPGKKRWMLVRDTGPKLPVLRQNGDVWDQNEQTLYTKPKEGQS